MQQTIQAALRGKIGAREIANVAYEMAGSGFGKSGDFTTVSFPTAELFTVLAKAAERRIGECNAQDLANTA